MNSSSSRDESGTDVKTDFRSLSSGTIGEIIEYLTFIEQRGKVAVLSRRMRDVCPSVFVPHVPRNLLDIKGSQEGGNSMCTFAKLPCWRDYSLDRLWLRCRWKDKGFSKRKGRIGLSIERDGEVMHIFTFGTNPAPHDWETFEEEVPLPVLQLMQPGDGMRMWFTVGDWQMLSFEDVRIACGIRKIMGASLNPPTVKYKGVVRAPECVHAANIMTAFTEKDNRIRIANHLRTTEQRWIDKLDDSTTKCILNFLTFTDIARRVAVLSRRFHELCPRMLQRLTAPNIDRIPGSNAYSTLMVVPNAASIRRLVVRFAWSAHGTNEDTRASVGLRIIRNGIEICCFRFGNCDAPKKIEVVHEEVPLSVLNLIERHDRVLIWFVVGSSDHGQTLTIRNFTGYCGMQHNQYSDELRCSPTVNITLPSFIPAQRDKLTTAADAILQHVMSFLKFEEISGRLAHVSKRMHALCPHIHPPLLIPDLVRARGAHGTDPSRLLAVVHTQSSVQRLVRMAVRCFWWDQGWGNRKGLLGVGLRRSGHELCRYSLTQTRAEHDWTYLYTEVSPGVLQQLEVGDQLELWYIVGGGGGHELNIRDLQVYMGTVSQSSCTDIFSGKLPPLAPENG